MVVSISKALSDLSKLEPLDGTNYKRWSQKLLIFFEQLDVDYVLFTSPPEHKASTETSTVAITPVITGNRPEEDAKVKYDKDNKTVRGHLLNHMNNILFDLFVNQKSAKEIWNTLETRYGGDDAGRKKATRPTNASKERIKKKTKSQPASQPTPQVNLTEQEEIIAVVVVEANLVENKTDWILDIGASKHFCSNKELFQELHEAPDGECVFMGNSTTAGVLGKGNIFLKLTSGKTIALNDVLYVPSLRRNLISGSLLNKAGLKIVLEADKVIITKNGDFVGKRYMLDGLFVLNTISATSNKVALDSVYLIESIDIWHGRLGHRLNMLKNLSNLSLQEAQNYLN
ncbi:UNVERIFIED_CONTAM: hypothetical protein Slati_0451700 [Sesamum latifolium]|uniref:Retrovirus-related Pol polyprotein from transposon TNT 1-94-like beta-barrel domain-containing protein n=1 Tax=Sesamum latifolium TaxID=2727402 RepID=A0AAW2XW91_9LAMI